MKPTTIFKSTILLNFTICLFLFVSCKNATQKTGSFDTSDSSYTSKMTKSDKKKYYDKGSVIYEVKYKADGFKLRTSSSSLLWKVKLYDKKIKISNNEENLNPYEIKIQEPYKAKLVKDDITIARTTYEANTQVQTVTNANSSEVQTISKSYAPCRLVKAIAEIPEDQKQLLIAELIAKGY